MQMQKQSLITARFLFHSFYIKEIDDRKKRKEKNCFGKVAKIS